MVRPARYVRREARRAHFRSHGIQRRGCNIVYEGADFRFLVEMDDIGEATLPAQRFIFAAFRAGKVERARVGLGLQRP